MEYLHKMKKSFIESFEKALSLIGKDLTKELEDKYLVDEEVFLSNAFNLASKLVKMEEVSQEDKNKCKEFLNCFYYLDKIKSIM